MEKMWEPRRLTTLCASTACYRDSFTFFLWTRNAKTYFFLNISVPYFVSRPRYRGSFVSKGQKPFLHSVQTGWESHIAFPPLEEKCGVAGLTTHFHIVPRLRKREAEPPHPHPPSARCMTARTHADDFTSPLFWVSVLFVCL
jgi:hypothetical protein